MAPDGSASLPVAKISNCRVPEMRAAFPGCTVHYEITVSSPNPWDALCFCASAFARHSLELSTVRCTKDGPAIFRVNDNGHADLYALERSFEEYGQCRILSWTTVIGRRRSVD